ncbi:MAG: type VII secretion protein EccB [Mycobacterium sp.]|nr:type VII secretion protein EccB [Mycobacterium sp.]
MPLNYSAALLVSAVGAVLIVGLCFMQAVFHPTGQVGRARVLAGRASCRPYEVPEDYR